MRSVTKILSWLFPFMKEPIIDPELEHNRAYVLLTFRRDFKNAISHLNLAIEHWGTRPGLEDVYYHRGVAYECIGEYDLSIGDLTKAIEICPDTWPLFSRGKAYCGKNDYAAALRDFLKAVELSPRDFQSLNAAAWLLACSPNEADRNGEKALELALLACEETNYQDYICLDVLACAYAELGEYQETLDWETKARELFAAQDDPDATFDFAKRELFLSGKPFREPANTG